MTDQKHYKYEAQDPLIATDTPEVEIKDVIFLTPAKVKMDWDGVAKEEILSIDLVSRKAYRDSKEVTYSDKIFDYLDRMNSLPEDFFEASEDIYDKAKEAKAEHDEMHNFTEGEINV